jgi:hypothetical protein
MSDRPLYDERIWEAMEVCRPGSADMSDPALGFLVDAIASDPQLEELLDRLQETDARLSAAMRDVPVPEGLADRLLQGLVSESRSAASPLHSTASMESDAHVLAGVLHQKQPILSQSRPRLISRRWLLLGMGSLAAAAALFIAFVLGLPKSPVYSVSMVCEQAIKHFNKESADPTISSQLRSMETAPEDYPIGQYLITAPGTRWRTVQDFLDREGVAYDLPEAGGSRATLYVLHCPVEGLPAAPPEVHQLDTGNCYTLAWQDQGRQLVYVLVYTGRPENAQYFLEHPAGPLRIACLWDAFPFSAI